MKLYEQIRKASERDGLSIRELAKRFGVHRRDVRQALASAAPPERKTPARAAPALDRFKPTIDGWIESDRLAPRKQRHTARRVWQRLVEEHQAQVGESTVRRYVAEVRRRMEVPLVEVMVPQHHPLGEEAEVDFGMISVYLAGQLVDVSLFIMRLSASGRAYPRAYLNEAQEVFRRPCPRLRTFRWCAGAHPLRQLEVRGVEGVGGPDPGRVGPFHLVAFALRLRQFLLPARHQGLP